MRSLKSILKKCNIFFQSEALRSSDIFGYPATLFINKESNYTTQISGTFSLGIIVLLIVVYYNKMISYVQMADIQSN